LQRAAHRSHDRNTQTPKATMYLVPPADRHRASPALRKRFMIALEQRDQPALSAAVRELLGCVNVLPATTCLLLGLASGSTFGDAAQAITGALSPRPYAA
jgi:hypothetical protein